MIRERNLPVAKLVPLVAEGAEAQELKLVAAGKRRLPTVRLDLKGLLKIPTGKVKGSVAVQAIREAASRQAQSYLSKFAPVVWWGSLVEVYSAICRLHREQEISDADKQGAGAVCDC